MDAIEAVARRRCFRAERLPVERRMVIDVVRGIPLSPLTVMVTIGGAPQRLVLFDGTGRSVT